MTRIEAFAKSRGISGVNEVGICIREFFHRGQVLGPPRQPVPLLGADQVCLPPSPLAAFHQPAPRVLDDQVFVPVWRVTVSILVVVVKAEQVSQPAHAPRALGKRHAASALGGRRHDVGMLVVIAAPNPTAHGEQHFVEFQIVFQVLRHLGGFLKRPVYLHRLFHGAALVHLPLERAP